MSKFKKGDRVKANARGVQASPNEIVLGMPGKVVEITSHQEYVSVDFDGGPQGAYMIDEELEMAGDPVGDRVSAVLRLVNAGLLSDNPEHRSGLLAMAAVLGADVSESGNKVIAALLGKG